MKKYKLDMIEVSLIGLIGIITVITYPPLQLLAIPFVAIAGMRGVFDILQSQEKPGKESRPKELGTTMMQKTSISDTRKSKKGWGKPYGY